MMKFQLSRSGRSVLLFFFSFLSGLVLYGQGDTSIMTGNKVVTLKEVVVRNNLDAAAFILRVKEDTSFYKAFKNLRILTYTSLNDIRVLDKKNGIRASLNSRTRQHRRRGCRWIEVLEESVTGDFYDPQHQYNYYTADLYASLFLPRDTVCGETNIVNRKKFNTKGKSRMEKHKEQLKMLFFDPGKKIPGLPFMGNKVALFDEDVSDLYDFEIDMDLFKGEMCYLFRMTPRPDLSSSERNRIVIKEMTTWFLTSNWQIVARNYNLSYKTLFYDFDVLMEVEMMRLGEWIVPQLLRYNGRWDVPFKKREKAIFTATLFDFEK